MSINQRNLEFAHRYYDLLRAWVQHNERHRQMLGAEANDIQTPLEEFIAQYDGTRS